jgi:DNA-binding response OmpR family regulator
LKVLVADDDLHVLPMYSQILRREGFAIITAKDGSDAVSKFINERPEIVILDKNMPKYTELQAASEILTMRQSTRVIILTSDMEVLQEAEAIGGRSVPSQANFGKEID